MMRAMADTFRSPGKGVLVRAVTLMERLTLNAGLTLLAFVAEKLLDRAFAAEPRSTKPRRKPPGFSVGLHGIHKLRR